MKRLAFLALPTLALACLLSLPEASFAQHRGGGGGRGGYHGGYGGYRGGYGGYGHYYGGYGRGYYPGWGIGIGLGYPYWGGWGGSYYASPGYYYSDPYAYSAPTYVSPSPGYQSSYPPSSTTQTSTAPGYVRIRVPADAQVFIDNTPTSQSGPDRVFVTPPLDPNQRYSYDISARWMENGQERSLNRTVQPMPGQTVDVDFMSPSR